MDIKVDQVSSVQQVLNEPTKKSDINEKEISVQKIDNKSQAPQQVYKDTNKKSEVFSVEDFAEKIAQKRAKELDEKQKQELIEKLKEKINKLLSSWNIQLDFTIDKDLDKVVVKVKDKDTGKVIRQIPPEEMLKIAKSIEEVTGLLLDLWG